MRQEEPVGAVGLIPRPPHKVVKRDSLMKCMGFKEKDRPKFNRATVTLRRLYPKYLDTGVLYSEQSGRDWSRFCAAACEAEPVFRRYENYWPIIIYMQPVLTRAKARGKARLGRPAPASEPGDKGQEDRTLQFEAAATHVRTADVSTTTPPAFTSHIVQRMSDFRAFLETVDPILGSHFERLATAGIRDPQSLEAFSNFPKHEKESFLSDHCGLGVPLDLVRVRLALDQAQKRCMLCQTL